MKKRSVLSTGLLVIALSVAPAISADAATPLHCGDTITQNTRLTADLACTTAVGLTVADGATLDLGGHIVSGPGAGSVDGDGNATVGVLISSGSVRGGTVTGWNAGVENQYGNTGTAAVTNVIAHGNTDGLFSQGTTTTAVTGSTFTSNTDGIYGYDTTLTVTRSRFAKNAIGIDDIYRGSLAVTASLFFGNDVAISADEVPYTLTGGRIDSSRIGVVSFDIPATITGTTFARNGTGVQVTSPTPVSGGTGATLDHVTMLGNTTGVDAEDTTTVTGGYFSRNATAVQSSPNGDGTGNAVTTVTGATLTHNGSALVLNGYSAIGTTRAYRNTGYGIYAPLATDLGGNVAFGNGTQPQCTGVTCSPAG